MVHLQREEIHPNLVNFDPSLSFPGHVKRWAGAVLGERNRSAHLQSLHQLWLQKHKPLDRTWQFWRRAVFLYASYKFCQLRCHFLGAEARDQAWRIQHEWAADRVYSLCSELGGFFLKVAQFIGKPDLAPDAWVRKLVKLCDAAPATPFPTLKHVLEKELGYPIDQLFEKFCESPIGSASVAQVHRAIINRTHEVVAVKVQHPGVEELMMTDIRNLKAFVAFVRRFDVKFDTLSVLNELEEQVGLEFDFTREAWSMDRIADSLSVANHGKPLVIVPKSIPGMVSRRALVMKFVEGTPILQLAEEMARRGINPNGTMARLAKKNILKELSMAYGHMILKDGFFQADPHPGNIMITNQGKVALLDYGQVKDFPNDLRLSYAELVLALSKDDPFEMGRCLEKLGVVVSKKIETDPQGFKLMVSSLFDTKMPPGRKKVTPFGKDSMLKEFPIEKFPQDLFFILRTIHLLRGLSVGMGVPYSCAEEWREVALDVLSVSEQGRDASKQNLGTSRELIWERRKRSKRLLYLTQAQG